MECYWLLTSTFYGNWLPGDRRGFVSRVREQRPEDESSRGAHAAPLAKRQEHDAPGTPYDKDMPGLHRSAQQLLRGTPVRIDKEEAQVLFRQFQETTTFRGWHLIAVAIMANHVHLVIGAGDNAEPTKILGDFKAYGSRALSARWGKPPAETWWTYGGSKRKLVGEHAVLAAVEYVRNQERALIVWINEPGRVERARSR
jgi:REP element-mobilizing transposase RayT